MEIAHIPCESHNLDEQTNGRCLLTVRVIADNHSSRPTDELPEFGGQLEWSFKSGWNVDWGTGYAITFVLWQKDMGQVVDRLLAQGETVFVIVGNDQPLPNSAWLHVVADKHQSQWSCFANVAQTILSAVLDVGFVSIELVDIRYLLNLGGNSRLVSVELVDGFAGSDWLDHVAERFAIEAAHMDRVAGVLSVSAGSELKLKCLAALARKIREHLKNDALHIFSASPLAGRCDGSRVLLLLLAGTAGC